MNFMAATDGHRADTRRRARGYHSPSSPDPARSPRESSGTPRGGARGWPRRRSCVEPRLIGRCVTLQVPRLVARGHEVVPRDPALVQAARHPALKAHELWRPLERHRVRVSAPLADAPRPIEVVLVQARVTPVAHEHVDHDVRRRHAGRLERLQAREQALLVGPVVPRAVEAPLLEVVAPVVERCELLRLLAPERLSQVALSASLDAADTNVEALRDGDAEAALADLVEPLAPVRLAEDVIVKKDEIAPPQARDVLLVPDRPLLLRHDTEAALEATPALREPDRTALVRVDAPVEL